MYQNMRRKKEKNLENNNTQVDKHLADQQNFSILVI
jgi:hypothetical protein